MCFLHKMSLMYSMLRLLDSPKQTHSKHHGKKLTGEKEKQIQFSKEFNANTGLKYIYILHSFEQNCEKPISWQSHFYSLHQVAITTHSSCKTISHHILSVIPSHHTLLLKSKIITLLQQSAPQQQGLQPCRCMSQNSPPLLNNSPVSKKYMFSYERTKCCFSTLDLFLLEATDSNAIPNCLESMYMYQQKSI